VALKVAIVGRPNVGKSTLFNRLAGKKLAIVDDRPGVTRDRRTAMGSLGDLPLELIDTAGFEDVDDESLEARMRAQTERAIDEADLCLFVMDAREGVTPLDRIFADLVRKRDKPVVVAANKSEGKAGDHGAAEAHGLGLGEPVMISGEHGEGMAELYAAFLAASPEEDEDDGDDDGFDVEALELGAEDDEDEVDETKPIRIAIVGRPNAGKSTLVNRLIGEDRMLTGPEAGITRDAIPVDWEYGGRPVRLVDTAGLRKKAKVTEGLERLSTGDTIRAITFAEVVILVMDAANAFETQDLQIADLVEREGRGLVFCIAKWDLVENPGVRLQELRETAERMLPQVRGAPLVALSAETGRGVDKLMPAVFGLHRNWATKVKTRDLNDWLAMATQRHPPPAVNGRRIKPKYMAQTKARPPTFVLFASRADSLPDHYRRYLINSMRESFDLPGVPIRITIKSNKNPYADASEGARKVATTAYPVSRDRHVPAEKPAKEEAAAKPKAKKAKVEPKSTRVRSAKSTAPTKKQKALARKPKVRIPTTHKLRKPRPPSRPRPKA
jgi:GTP-binding protein